MNDHLTPERLDQIRGRVEAATDGPWTETYNPSDEWTTITGQSHLLDGEIWMLCPEVATCEGEPWDDSNFIAHARQDIPNLLAHIDAQAATIQRVRDICMDTDGNYLENEAECNTVGDILEAIYDGQRPPEHCGNCGGRGEEFINVDRDVSTCHVCDGTGFDGGWL